MREEELIGNVMALVIVGLVFVVVYAILAGIAYYLMKSIQALPQEHQLLPPWAPWLILIPCVNVFVNFWIFLQIPKSYEMNAISRNEAPDPSLFVIGLIYSILSVLTFIPYLGSCFGIVALILLIVFLVKVSTLKQRLESMAGPPVSF
ncbi:MAG: hypothetical protein IT378_26970 [Sandaracinaceae bacterium]|nr:hypothetical protein [Sandaracinaceae bacterium]